MQGRKGQMTQDTPAAWEEYEKRRLGPPAEQDQDIDVSGPGDRGSSYNHEAVGDIQDGKSNPARGKDTIEDKELQTYDLVSLNSNSTYMEEEVKVAMIRSYDREPQSPNAMPEDDNDTAGNTLKVNKPGKPGSPTVNAPTAVEENGVWDVQRLQKCERLSDASDTTTLKVHAETGRETDSLVCSSVQPEKKRKLVNGTDEELRVIHGEDRMPGTEAGRVEVVAELHGDWQVNVFPASEVDPTPSKSPIENMDQTKGHLQVSQPSRLFGEEPESKHTSENEEETEARRTVAGCGSVEQISREANRQLEPTPSRELQWEPPIAMEQVSIMSFSLLEDAEEAPREFGMHGLLNGAPCHSKENSAAKMKALKDDIKWESKGIPKNLAKVHEMDAQTAEPRELAEDAKDVTMMVVESFEGSPTDWIDPEYGWRREDLQATKALQSHSIASELDKSRRTEKQNSTATLPVFMTHRKVATVEASKSSYIVRMEERCDLTCAHDANDHFGEMDNEPRSLMGRESLKPPNQEDLLGRTEPMYESNPKNAVNVMEVLNTTASGRDEEKSNEIGGSAKDLPRRRSINKDATDGPSQIPRTSTPTKWTQVGPLQSHDTLMTIECVSELTPLTSEDEDEEDFGMVKSGTEESPGALELNQWIEKVLEKNSEEKRDQSNPHISLNATSKEETRGSAKWKDRRGVLPEGGATVLTEEALAMPSFPTTATENPQTYNTTYDRHEGKTLGEDQMHTMMPTSKTEVARGVFGTLNTIPIEIQAESTSQQHTCDTTLWERMTTPIRLEHISEMTSFTSEEEHSDRHHDDYPKSQTVSTSRDHRRQEETMLLLRSEAPSAKTEQVYELTPLCSTTSGEEDEEGIGQDQSKQEGQGTGTRPSHWIGVEMQSRLAQENGRRRLDIQDPALPRNESLQTVEVEGQLEYPTPLHLTDGASEYMETGDEGLTTRPLLKVTHLKTETSETGTVDVGGGGGASEVDQLLQRAQQCMPYERLQVGENREPIHCVSLTEGATTTAMLCGAVHVSFNPLDNTAPKWQVWEQHGKTDSFPVASHGLFHPNASSKLISTPQTEAVNWIERTVACSPVTMDTLQGRPNAKADVIATAAAAADTSTATSMVREKVASGLEEIATENEVTTRCLDETFAAVWWCTPAQSVRPYTGDHDHARQRTAVHRSEPASKGEFDREEASALHQIITVTLPLSTNAKISAAAEDEVKSEGGMAEERNDGPPLATEKSEDSQQKAEDGEIGKAAYSATPAEPPDAFVEPSSGEVVRRVSARKPSPERRRKSAIITVVGEERTTFHKQPRVKVKVIKEVVRPVKSSERFEEQDEPQMQVVTEMKEQQQEDEQEVDNPLYREPGRETPLQTEEHSVEGLTADSMSQQASSRTESYRRRDALMTAIYLDGLIRDTVAALRCRPKVNRLDPAARRQVSCFCWRR
ncbi:hypothetical protein SprV_0602087200 [Sparganum proliferum]